MFFFYLLGKSSDTATVGSEFNNDEGSLDSVLSNLGGNSDTQKSSDEDDGEETEVGSQGKSSIKNLPL